MTEPTDGNDPIHAQTAKARASAERIRAELIGEPEGLRHLIVLELIRHLAEKSDGSLDLAKVERSLSADAQVLQAICKESSNVKPVLRTMELGFELAWIAHTCPLIEAIELTVEMGWSSCDDGTFAESADMDILETSYFVMSAETDEQVDQAERALYDSGWLLWLWANQNIDSQPVVRIKIDFAAIRAIKDTDRLSARAVAERALSRITV